MCSDLEKIIMNKGENLVRQRKRKEKFVYVYIMKTMNKNKALDQVGKLYRKKKKGRNIEIGRVM